MRETQNRNERSPTSKRNGVTGDLGERIAQARGTGPTDEAAEAMRRNEMSGVGRGFRYASEFVAAIVVGAGLGLGIDRLFGTTPWAMITLMILGFCAGVLNVVRATAETNAATPLPPDAGPVPDDEDD